jgi:hypothetical protein
MLKANFLTTTMTLGLVIGSTHSVAEPQFKPSVFNAYCNDENLSSEEERTINAIIASELQIDRAYRNPELCHRTSISLLSSTGLHLLGEGIRDLSPLSTIPHLNTLILSNNKIEDISVLALLPNLERVDLDGNQIKDFAVLKKLPRLKQSVIKNNPGMAAWHMSQRPKRPKKSTTTKVVHHYHEVERQPRTHIHVGWGYHHGHYGHRHRHGHRHSHRHGHRKWGHAEFGAAMVGLGAFILLTD